MLSSRPLVIVPSNREEAIVPSHINLALELLAQDQAIYYVGGHSGHVLTYSQGREDAHTWADYINVGMEHGASTTMVGVRWPERAGPPSTRPRMYSARPAMSKEPCSIPILR